MGKIVRLNPVPIRVSAFGIGRVRDDELVPGADLIPFIYNVADAEIEAAGKPVEASAAGKPLNTKGKRAGLGFPGGGMEAEEWEDPPAAVRREYEREFGLKVSRVSQAFPEIRKIILTDNETGRLDVKYYEKGQQPPVLVDVSKLPDGRPRQEAVDNHWYAFFVDLAAWEGSPHQKLFRRYKRKLIESGELTEEEVAQEGMSLWFDELEPDELASLKIEEINEVAGLMLFPVDFLRYKFATYPKNPLDSPFYKSHLRALVRAMDEQKPA